MSLAEWRRDFWKVVKRAGALEECYYCSGIRPKVAGRQICRVSWTEDVVHAGRGGETVWAICQEGLADTILIVCQAGTGTDQVTGA